MIYISDVSAPRSFFKDRTNDFKTLSKSLEQKYISKFNEKPGVSRKNENRPSQVFINISSSIMPVAKEMYEFRKMLVEKSQDYIFATKSYSKMSQDEREELDETIKLFMTQFGSLLNQIGHRITTTDGFRHASERNHLQRIFDGIQNYMKEIAEYVQSLRREYLKRVQEKSKSLVDRITEVEKSGYKLNYYNGLNEFLRNTKSNNGKLVQKLNELQKRHSCLDFEENVDHIEELSSENAVDNNMDSDKNNEDDQDGWENIDDFDLKTAENPLIDAITDAAAKLTREVVRRKDVSPFSQMSEPVVRKRKNVLQEPETNEINDTYAKWKSEQGDVFDNQLQEQTEIMREQFVSSEKDDEVDRLEYQISEIQSLSSVFSEKIMDQERDIDVINDLALHTTENIVDGNEWIRKAITNSALRRVVLLFCIIVLTFTLLFLDWFNP